MATRPAPRRVAGGGLTGLHYGLIAFVIVSVAALGGFIWQLTQVNKLETDLKRVNDRLASYGQPPSYYQNEAESRRSNVFAVLDDDRKALAKLITGSVEATARSAETDANTLLRTVEATHPKLINPTDTLLTAIRKLDRELNKVKATAAERGEAAEKLQSEYHALNESIKGVKDDFQAQVAAMNDQISKVQAALTKYQEERDAQLATIQSASDQNQEEINRIRQAALRERKNLELEMTKLSNQNEELKKAMEALKPTSFDAEAILTKADGRVLRAIPGSDVVYINLGEEDNIKIGMGFEIFSPTRESADEELRGKASVEVVSVRPGIAECRLTRSTPGRPIIEGDFAVNISYERGRRPKFVVAGSFDLNYDGAEDPDGLEKIKSMITEWGGQVVPELDETVDFVVIGRKPGVPTPSGPATDVVAAQKLTREEQSAEFSNLIAEARALFIPVINQNQFLFLTGYSGEMRLSAR